MGVFGVFWIAAALAASENTHSLRVNRALRATHSRRETNRFMVEGRLLVNGIAATNPDARLRLGDKVQFDGETVSWEEDKIEPHRYLKYNKPAGVVCTTDRRVPHNIMDALQSSGSNNNATRRVYPIGRLDAASTGLILLTSDGAIVNPLLRPGEKKSKEYHVTTSPVASNDDVKELASGVVITTVARVEGGLADVTARTLPCTVERIGDGGDDGEGVNGRISDVLKFVLGEGRNRQIRKMTATMGMEVTSLHRVSFAGVSLAGCEESGNWAILTETEEIAIGARKLPSRNDLRSPEEKARRKAKKLAKRISVHSAL